MSINFRVEYEPIPLRHVAVQCPHCRKWFIGWDILQDGELRYNNDLEFAKFYCPVCKRSFTGYDPDSGFEIVTVEECNDSTEVYKNCLRKEIVWKENE